MRPVDHFVLSSFAIVAGAGWLPVHEISQILPSFKHQTSRYSNNRAENFHRPTRRRERQMQRFQPPGHAKDFLSAHAIIYGHFRPRRHCLSAVGYRRAGPKRFGPGDRRRLTRQMG
jgi:transposase-like protein